MKEHVIDFSFTPRSSSDEVANALLKVSQMGFRGSEALELMEFASRSAGAAFTDAGSMATLLVSAGIWTLMMLLGKCRKKLLST